MKRMVLESWVLLQALVVITVQIDSFLFSSLLPLPVFASVFIRNTVLSALHCGRALTFCLPCCQPSNYPLLNMAVAWTKKFIKHTVSLSLSEPLSSGIYYYRQKDCAGKINSAKKCTVAIHWLTRTIGGGLSLSNWPFVCVSKAYPHIYILTSKANSACLLREWEGKHL